MWTLIYYILVAVALIFWVVQLIDVLCRDVKRFESHTHKLIWFLVILVGNIVGAIWYFVWKRRSDVQRRLEIRKKFEIQK